MIKGNEFCEIVFGIKLDMIMEIWIAGKLEQKNSFQRVLLLILPGKVESQRGAAERFLAGKYVKRGFFHKKRF